MPKYAVPALVKLQALVLVEADNAADAKRRVSAGEGNMVCLGANSVYAVSSTEGASIRKGPVKRVDAGSELAQELDAWDDDKGVAW